mgnify:CR=1 FL=1
MMILNELRKHGRLAAKRHPMYEKNKVAKILGYVMALSLIHISEPTRPY